MTVLAPEAVAEELSGVAAALVEQFAGRVHPDRVREVVAQTHRDLAAQATVVAFLIPLTANRARTRLDAEAGVG
ncbi:hypothetical protein L6E12_16990 [Actinokineospora sp. PR83]|uniref:three-helix bundle dimerization domain-containing protein n=1 Tax=Actinokineospora sp. PR83 TaxID=2884908 RepID=UPI001F3815B0|nr:hypothetical protein [Actinokineospora sp. PR83]MCG8917483.1 hypothetical protein [Actinokineospora sp. PR83]